MKKYCFGVDIGGTSVKLGLFTCEGELLDKWEIPTAKADGGAAILTDVATSLEKKLSERNLTKEEFVGVGIGIPGPVSADGTVFECVNLGWGTTPVKAEMEKLIGLTTAVGNDANVAALGEQWQGGGKGFESSVMITLGTGVGGGVILNGEILAGANGAAGEIGHLYVNYEEEDLCNCGKPGCLEQYASATGIVKEAKRYLAAHDEPTSLRGVEPLSAKIICDAAKNGDSVAQKMVDQLGRYLAIACSHLSHVVDPEVFVIGGGVSKAGEILLDAIRRHYDPICMKAVKGKPFKLATLGNDAGIYGSAKMVLGK